MIFYLNMLCVVHQCTSAHTHPQEISESAIPEADYPLHSCEKMPTWHTPQVGNGTDYADKISSNLLFGYTKNTVNGVHVGNSKFLSSQGEEKQTGKQDERQRDKDSKTMIKTETRAWAV